MAEETGAAVSPSFARWREIYEGEEMSEFFARKIRKALRYLFFSSYVPPPTRIIGRLLWSDPQSMAMSMSFHITMDPVA